MLYVVAITRGYTEEMWEVISSS